MVVAGTLKQMIRTWRRTPPLRALARACEGYLSAWYNEEYFDFDRNGEAFAASRFAEWARGREVVVWDVGAHQGEWSDLLHLHLPHARVHSFEILPQIAARIPERSWRTVHVTGLSDRRGAVDVHWSTRADTCNSITPRTETAFFADAVEVVPCEVTTGDELLSSIPPPALLKIDTEGHEANVLRGCGRLLRSAEAPAMIQFEYGSTYIPAGATLREIYGLLPGYEIGRLYPSHVDFKPYAYADDHFRIGNMIAVRDPELKRLLA